MPGHVLVVDDDREMGALLAAGLSQRGFRVTYRPSAEDAIAALDAEPFDVVLTDVRMDGMDGFDLCAEVRRTHAEVPVLLLTGHGTLESATLAIRAGAADFFTKPPDMDAIALGIGRAVEEQRLRGEVRRLRDAAPGGMPASGLLGESPAMRQLREVIARVADADASVLVSGDSGTGKELVARALHAHSRRASGPFVAVNCAAVPESLLETELFGHVRGAFTDARERRAGLFMQAHGGTLFLDEVGELPLALQPKLLRVLQERRVRPVGGDQEQPVDVRVVAATNRDLEQAVRERRFREDLWFRLNVIAMDVPALRERGNDVLVLAQHFLSRCAAQSGKAVVGLSPAAAEALLDYRWPGNVRELQNAIERAVVFARHEEIVVDDLPLRVRRPNPIPVSIAAPARTPLVPLRELERTHILQVLEAMRGNRTLAAQVLEVDRKTLFRKLKQWRAEERAAEHGAGEGTPLS